MNAIILGEFWQECEKQEVDISAFSHEQYQVFDFLNNVRQRD